MSQPTRSTTRPTTRPKARPSWLWLCGAPLVASLAACASAPPPAGPALTLPTVAATGSPPAKATPPEPASTAKAQHGQRGLAFVVRDGKDRSPLAAAALHDRLRRARAIYVGEHHNNVLSHHAQLFILSQVYRLKSAEPAEPAGYDLAVGLEMLPRRLQPQIDAYLTGAIDEPGFLQAVDWSHTWGFDYALYRPIFEFCRAHGLRMYALNAPRELPRAVRQKGLSGLSSDEQALLPSGAPWPMPEPHRRFVRSIFDQHPEGPKADPALRDAAFERFYSAQLVWDEAMAQAVADILQKGPQNPRPPARLIVLAGVGHVGPYAMPARASRRGAPAALTFAPQEDEKDPPPPPPDPESTDLTIVLPAHNTTS